jgi:signal transduction histidine kinase
MDSYFAPAERNDDDEILREIATISSNPVIDTLLKSVTGLLAVLNEYRQILAVNDEFLKTLGVDSAGELLGLRPGEAIKCDHAHDMPGGCGTSRFCATCGAAIAIVVALEKNRIEERECIIEVSRDDKRADLHLRIKAYPFRLHGQLLILLFLQDITARKRKAATERVYFHDIENIILSLNETIDNFDHEDESSVRKFAKHVEQLSLKLAKEVEVQKIISETEFGDFKFALRGVTVGRVFQELRSLFSDHPAADGKHVNISEDVPDHIIKTDLELLVRVLASMLTNALEATKWGGKVKLWLEQAETTVTFCVWNEEMMRKNVARRIFKRRFTTKKEAGRGFGTYSMKLFGERYLKGKVSFTTSTSMGTIFRLKLPTERQAAAT